MSTQQAKIEPGVVGRRCAGFSSCGTFLPETGEELQCGICLDRVRNAGHGRGK